MAHKSKSEDTIKGSYRVLFPDGRSQVVNFETDNYGKFRLTFR